MKKPYARHCQEAELLLPLMKRMLEESDVDGKERGFKAYKDPKTGKLTVVDVCLGTDCDITFTQKVTRPHLRFHTHPREGADEGYYVAYPSGGDYLSAALDRKRNVECIGGDWGPETSAINCFRIGDRKALWRRGKYDGGDDVPTLFKLLCYMRAGSYSPGGKRKFSCSWRWQR